MHTGKPNEQIDKDKNNVARTKMEQVSVNDKIETNHLGKSNKGSEKMTLKSELPKSNQPIYVSIRRSTKTKEDVHDSASVDEIVETIKRSKMLKEKKNREELLRIINNFLKFKKIIFYSLMLMQRL